MIANIQFFPLLFPGPKTARKMPHTAGREERPTGTLYHRKNNGFAGETFLVRLLGVTGPLEVLCYS